MALLHGLGGSARYWDRVTAALDGVATIAPDLLGFGRSPKPPDAAYDVDTHLAAVLPLVPADSVVVAHSAGGILAAALAARHPDRVAGLVLIGLAAFPDPVTARRQIGQLGPMARWTVESHRAAAAACWLMCRLRPAAIATAPLLLRHLPPAVAADAVRHTWPSYSRTLQRVVVDHRVGPDLAAVEAPVVLVHGTGDACAPPAYVEELAADLAAAGRDVTLRLLDGDHHLALTTPAAVAAIVEEVMP